jgi:hypothetical protein
MSKVTKELSGDLEDKILTLTFRRHLKSHFGEVAATFSSITSSIPVFPALVVFPAVKYCGGFALFLVFWG